jgi:hypothetical protein
MSMQTREKPRLLNKMGIIISEERRASKEIRSNAYWKLPIMRLYMFPSMDVKIIPEYLVAYYGSCIDHYNQKYYRQLNKLPYKILQKPNNMVLLFFT